jgi:acetyl esterase/lipase
MKRLLLAVLLGLMGLGGGPLRAAEAPPFTRTEDVIYGRKFGLALTLDVFEPAKKNGAAIFWVVSGGYRSAHDNIKPATFAPLLQRGYTVFAIVHGSNPRFVISEIQQDVHRAVRFVRHHADRWGVERNRCGIGGSSAGGHLALSIGTQTGAALAEPGDSVDRESSAVQAVAAFFPPTDFLNWSRADEPRVPPTDVVAVFGPKWETPEGRQEFGRAISPIYLVSARTPPTLVIHGDADARVPLYQSQIFERKCREAGVTTKLIIRPGAGHGYAGWQKDVALCADWFDEHLRGIKAPAR